MRYFAAKYEFYPTDNDEKYEMDRVAEDFYDVFQAIMDASLLALSDDIVEKQKYAIDKFAAFVKKIEPRLTKDFLFGAKQSMVDFWIGSIYVNYAINPDAFGRDLWAEFCKANPKYEEYGKRFAAANKKYLEERKPSPF